MFTFCCCENTYSENWFLRAFKIYWYLITTRFSVIINCEIKIYKKIKMSASPMQRQAIVIPSKRVMLTDASQLPDIYSSTPNGTLYSTTPGGKNIFTKIISLNHMTQIECLNLHKIKKKQKSW